MVLHVCKKSISYKDGSRTAATSFNMHQVVHESSPALDAMACVSVECPDIRNAFLFYTSRGYEWQEDKLPLWLLESLGL